MTRLDPTRFLASHILVGYTLAIALVWVAFGGCSRAMAQAEVREGGEVTLNNGIPREVQDVKVDQKLGGQIQLNLPLTDSSGRRVKTGAFFDGKKPTIITLNYSDCPMLCSVQLDQLTKSLAELDLKIGRDFQMLTVSIDPKETTEAAAKTKSKYVDLLRKTQPSVDQGWTFCTAQKSIITRLADNLGFRFTYDSKSGEYYHPAMLAFVSPEGVISRYSLAVDFPPEDMRKALVEAGEGTIGTPVDQILLWCFSYDPDSNSYVPQAWRMMRLAGAGTVGLMLACLAPYWVGRKAFPRKKADAESASVVTTDQEVATDKPETI